MRDFLAQQRFVPWRFVWREESNTFRKAPCASLGRLIGWTNPEEWMTAPEVSKVCDRYSVVFKKGRQIGFVFSPDHQGHLSGYAAVDLDGCINKDTGEIAEWATSVVDQLDSYTELSPSGTGLRIICKASSLDITKRVIVVDAPARNGRRPQMELFYATGFVTITLKRVRDQLTVADRTDLLREMFPKRHSPSGLVLPTTPVSTAAPELTLSDEELLVKARKARNGAKFSRLFDQGDTSAYLNDRSRTDYALLRMLRWWTRADAQQIRRLALNSALARPKWQDMRGEVDWLDYVIHNYVLTEGGPVYLEDGVMDACDAEKLAARGG